MLSGGAFEQGASGMGLYDSSILANKTNTVVVTMNYRLGALGFLVTNSIGGQFGETFKIKIELR